MLVLVWWAWYVHRRSGVVVYRAQIAGKLGDGDALSFGTARLPSFLDNGAVIPGLPLRSSHAFVCHSHSSLFQGHLQVEHVLARHAFTVKHGLSDGFGAVAEERPVGAVMSVEMVLEAGAVKRGAIGLDE